MRMDGKSQSVVAPVNPQKSRNDQKRQILVYPPASTQCLCRGWAAAQTPPPAHICVPHASAQQNSTVATTIAARNGIKGMGLDRFPG